MRKDKFREIVLHAYYNTEYYRKIYDEKRINVESAGKDSFPYITQLELIENAKRIKARDENIFRVSSSSGTTNHPKTLYRTQEDFDYSVKLMRKLLDDTGITNKDIIYIGQPFDLASFGYLVLEGCKQIGAMSIPGGLGQSDDKMLELILYYETNIIMTAPSRMKHLTDIVKKEKTVSEREKLISLVDKIVLAGEPLEEYDRKELQRFWNSTIFNYYGSEETDSLGMAKDDECIKLLDEGFEFEFIDLGDEIYELVITSLYHKGTPLIKYKIGDLVKYYGKKEGSHLVKVIGKNMDYINLYDGVKLYAYQISEYIKKYIPEFSGFQILYKKEEYIDVITVLIKSNCVQDKEIEKCLEENVWNASIDLDALRAIGNTKFQFLVNKEDFIMTRRGKTPKVVYL